MFYEPTVLVDVNHDMDCMREETFGPTLPVMKVRDVDEAVTLANDSTYGLASSVYTKDLAKGEAIARRLRAGSAAVNDGIIQFLARKAPFGGVGESGIGSRHAKDGITKYTEAQTILITRFGMKKDLGWYPNSAPVTRLAEKMLSRYYGR